MIDSLITIPTESNPEQYKLLLPLGLLLLFAKLLSMLFKRIHLPQVIGSLLSGLIVGLIFFIPGQTILTDYSLDGIKFFAKIGVILILFLAGAETDLNKVKQVGLVSFFVAFGGVVVPMLMAFGVGILFDIGGGKDINVWSDLYYGVILSATSVSITVATLKELGKLDSKVGNTLVSAAIIDDIIGIIVLSLVISLSSTGGESSAITGDDLASLTMRLMPSDLQSSAGLNIFFIVLYMAVFFGITILLGYFLRKLFNWLGNKYPGHIRIAIISLACCFIWAWVAELFNIADITGAYLMGLIFSSTSAHTYIDHRAETTENYIFGPIFFSSIALNLFQTDINFSDPAFISFCIFGLVWVVVGIVGKVVGAGLIAKAFHFTNKESLKVGVGMMARAEVLLVCAQKGMDAGLVDDKIMVFCLLLILVSSFLVPIALKLLFKGETDEQPTIALTKSEEPKNAEITK